MKIIKFLLIQVFFTGLIACTLNAHPTKFALQLIDNNEITNRDIQNIEPQDLTINSTGTNNEK